MTTPLRTAVEEHLSSKGVTLWADWDITRPDSFVKAADWFEKEIVGVLENYNRNIQEHAGAVE